MENEKKQVEVIIRGKVYKLAGMESEDYIQGIARYIDKKLDDIYETTPMEIIHSSDFPILMAINIADDLIKEKQKAEYEKEERSVMNEQEIKRLTAENGMLRSTITKLNVELEKTKKELEEFIEEFDTKTEEDG